MKEHKLESVVKSRLGHGARTEGDNSERAAGAPVWSAPSHTRWS